MPAKYLLIIFSLFLCHPAFALWGGSSWGSMVWGQSQLDVPIFGWFGYWVLGSLLFLMTFYKKLKGNVVRLFSVIVLLFITMASFAEEIELIPFQNSEVADADDVNENFNALKDAIERVQLMNVYQGPKGDQGVQGPQGLQGVKGDVGDTGAQGLQGLKGDKGDMGAQGPQGLKGDQGDTGAQGPQGLKGDQGDQGVQGLQGVKGDVGDTGAQGPQGLKGDQGDQGVQGLKGDKGDTGAQGPQGLKGDKGDTGAQGPQGLKGDQGDQGVQGPQGSMGLMGYPGAQGIQGIQGLKGDKGDQGDQGPQGIQGSQGATGPQGPAGPSNIVAGSCNHGYYFNNGCVINHNLDSNEVICMTQMVDYNGYCSYTAEDSNNTRLQTCKHIYGGGHSAQQLPNPSTSIEVRYICMSASLNIPIIQN